MAQHAKIYLRLFLLCNDKNKQNLCQKMQSKIIVGKGKNLLFKG